MGRRTGTFPAWNTDGYGCIGGAGPNTGKKAAKFRVVFPDGTDTVKRVFNVPGEGIAAVYYADGENSASKGWHVATVVDANDPGEIERFFVFHKYDRAPAERISG